MEDSDGNGGPFSGMYKMVEALKLCKNAREFCWECSWFPDKVRFFRDFLVIFKMNIMHFRSIFLNTQIRILSTIFKTIILRSQFCTSAFLRFFHGKAQ
jgi:hypothetical protein